MPTTARGVFYPLSSAAVRIWEIIQQTAESVDDAIDAASTWVAEDDRTTSSTTVTTTETVVQFVSFTSASTTARYKITAIQSTQSSVADDNVQVRLRWATGGTVTTAGTQIASALPNADKAGRGNTVTLVKTFVPGVTGTVTVGVTIVRATGTGNVISFGSAQMVNTILVEKG